jgi:hypothetical protein
MQLAGQPASPFWLDREASAGGTVLENIMRRSLMVGTAGPVLMVPLAANSAERMIALMEAAR